jgi:hypothetical protein
MDLAKLTAKIHQVPVKMFTLFLIIGEYAISWYEAYMLTTFEFSVGNKVFTAYDVAGNFAPMFLGSLCAMALPGFIQGAKSKFSLGGTKLHPLEIFVVLTMLVVIFYTPYYMYLNFDFCLNEQLASKKITESMMEYRLHKTTGAIIISYILAILIGASTIYELEK